jgi:RNA polymerase sigma factor (sigma-70 family)
VRVKRKEDPVSEFLAGRPAMRLTPNEEKEYADKAKAGDHGAVEALLCSQAHWIWTICYHHPRPPQISADELFNECITWAFIAIKNYDPDKGRYSSFLSRVIPRKCSDYIVRTCSAFGKDLPKSMKKTSVHNSFMTEEDQIKSILAEQKESNIYEDEYHSEVDELAEVVISILADMEPRSRWIVSRRMEGLTAVEIAAEETEHNLRSGRDGRVIEPASVMQALYAIRREVFRELMRRDIPIDCCVPGSRIGNLFDETSNDAQARLFV